MTDTERRKQDFEFFLDSMENLYKMHGNKFVAIKNKKHFGSLQF